VRQQRLDSGRTHLGKGRVKVTILAKTFYAFLCGLDIVEPGVDQNSDV